MSLLFHEIAIVSKLEKKARRISFSPTKNVILGQNDVGKSTVIKSLYHCLGADAPQLNNRRWRDASPIYYLNFSINKVAWHIVRDGTYFGVFNEKKELVGKYQGISRSGGISQWINKVLNFNISLEASDGAVRQLGPSYYFLPFYIDQDEGWNSSWSSFSGLQGIKKYRQEMIDYHLGIKPQKYYDSLKLAHEIQADLSKLSADKSALISVRDRYRERKNRAQIDLDPSVFQKEIEELVDQYNVIHIEQQDVISRIKVSRNKKLVVESEKIVLSASMKELDRDYSFLEKPETPDVIGCPTCGSEFHNSIGERFSILDDIDYCSNLIDQKKKEIIEIEKDLKELEAEYAGITKKLSSVEALLNRKRENVTFSEIVRSEGIKDILESISADITSTDQNQADLEKQLMDTKAEAKIDSKNKSVVVRHYMDRMKEYLNTLNVHVLEESDFSTPYKVIKSNALGSDLPRSLLAQYFAFLNTMNKYNKFVVCPMVVDSPLQQEQDNNNRSSIFNFIFSHVLADQQLILGTLNLLEDEIKGIDIKQIDLDTEFGLLTASQYYEVLSLVGPLHEATLAASDTVQ